MPRATPQYTKRIKYNLIVCDIAGTPIIGEPAGNYIRLDQIYNNLTIVDTNRILTNADGKAKILEYDTLLVSTLDQLFSNGIEILMFNDVLTGGCLSKTNNYLGL